MIRILHADDHVMFTEGLSFLFTREEFSNYSIVNYVHSGSDILAALELYHPNVLFLDLNIPEINGLALIPEIRDIYADMKILVLTEYEDPKFVRRALKSGADGYILKSNPASYILEALDEIMQGEVFMDRKVSLVSNGDYEPDPLFEDEFTLRYQLTPRELEILNLISQSNTNKDIGEQLYISDQTVSVHRKNLMRKLGVNNTAALIKKALRHHLISDT